MSTYMEDPSPEKALDVFFEIDLPEFERQAEATDQPHSRPMVIAFYVQLLNGNPGMTLPFAERLVSQHKPAHASLGTDIIAAASTPDRSKALEHVMKEFSLPPEAREMIESREVFDYRDLDADHAQTLDILWACYFASGEESFVRSIAALLRDHPASKQEAVNRIRELGATNPNPGTAEYGELWALVLGETARMGLGVNSQTHPGVRSIVEQLVGEESQSLRAILRPMLESGKPAL